MNKNSAVTGTANSGNQSIHFTQKAGIVMPVLNEGAGTLIYYGNVTNRQVTVQVSSDNSTWTTVESYKTTTDWSRHMVTINDASVRYIKFSINSNKQFYLDDVLVTKPDGTDGDGNVVVSNLELPYFTEGFNESGLWPTSGVTGEQRVTVAGQGEWILNNAYRATNSTYILDGSAGDMRMMKNGSTVITPVLSQGVVKVRLSEGRGKAKALNVYTSTDGGTTWKLIASPATDAAMEVMVGERDVNRIKFENTTSNDYDIDNVTIYAFAEGTPATVTTGAASRVTASTAVVGGEVTSAGDRAMIERGVCWSADGEPTIEGAHAAAVSAGEGAYSVNLTGLPAASTVSYRAYVLTLAGVAYGEVKSFTTPAPTTATLAINSIAENEEMSNEEFIYMTITATVTDNGGADVQAAGICYSTDGSEPVKEVNAVAAIVDNGTKTFSVDVPLQQLTDYKVRAWVTTAAGTGYSATQSVTTGAIVIPDYAHKVYYCSPDGDDATADGSKEAPFYNVQHAIDLVAAGDTIYMKAGTYNYTTRINVPTIGAKNSGMIVLKALGGRAVLDFTGMAVANANQGMRMSGSYWHLYGLDFCNAGDNGLLIERNKPTGGSYADIAANVDQAHHNIIENCAFYRNADTGLQMKNLAAYNMVINCDSYFNADPGHGNADGFAVKLSHGEGNYFYGCRAWNNSDDGWDQFIKKEGGFPDDITTTLEMCWAFNNGYLENGTAGSGNGNGFKMGSNEGRNNVILNRCVAFDNLQKGFDQNHNTGHMILNNCSAYSGKYLDNKSHFTYRIDEAVAAGHEIRFTNCVAISDGQSDRNKSAYAPYSVSGTHVTSDFNTLPSDYVSIDTKLMASPRQADGSLPETDFMRIAPGNSKLIDKGTPVIPYSGESVRSHGIEYAGAAPDLGWLETGIVSGVTTVVADSHGGLTVRCSESGLVFVTIAGAKVTDVNTIRVVDIQGRVVKSFEIEGSTGCLDMSGVGRGVYVLSADGVTGSAKIVR